MSLQFRCVLLFLVFPICLQAQNMRLIDSLSQIQKTISIDTQRILLLDKISFAYSSINPDSGIMVANDVLSQSQKINWEKGISAAYADLGINHAAKSLYVNALKYYSQALSIYRKNNYTKGIAAMYSNMALIYQSQADYAQALTYNLKALEQFELMKDTTNMAISNENIGSVYLEQKNYDKTTQYFQTAVTLNKKINNKAALARNMGNMGIVLDNKGNYTQARENHFAALKMNRELGHKYGEQINLANLGIVHLHLKDYEKALFYNNQALAISKEMGDINSIAVNMGNIGETYLLMAQNPSYAENKNQYAMAAISHLSAAVNSCRETNFMGPAVEFSEQLARAYAFAGNYKEAYQQRILYSRFRDSMFSMERAAQIANLEFKREADLQKKDLQIKDKQLQIARLKIKEKQNERILYIIGISLLVAAVAALAKGIYDYRKSNKNLAAEKAIKQNIILEQTKDIAARNRVLSEIAHLQSHDVRGYVATILGLVSLFNKDDSSDPINAFIVDGITESTQKLDTTIKEIVAKENELPRHD